MSGRYFSRSCLLLLLLSPVCGANIALAYDVRDGPLVTVEIADNEFRVPRDYFLSHDAVGASKRDQIWIHALWPDMAPMREDNRDRYIHVRGHGPLLNILATDQRRTTTLEFRLGAPYVHQDDAFGLKV